MDDLRIVERALETTTKISARGVQVYYGEKHALKDVDCDIPDKMVSAFIGEDPS
jgi:phosphate transport system ATP-binding protein